MFESFLSASKVPMICDVVIQHTLYKCKFTTLYQSTRALRLELYEALEPYV
jgi:hypothetical protein